MSRCECFGNPAPGATRSNRAAAAGLLAEPSEAVIGSAENVVRLGNEVRSLELQQEKEERLDWFRDREAREAAAEADRYEAELLQESQEYEEELRQRWEVKWIEYGLKSVPYDVPREHKLKVHQSLAGTLQGLTPTHPDSITRELVDAAVANGLASWNFQKTVVDGMNAAMTGSHVPVRMRSDPTWKARMFEAVKQGFSRLRNGATANEIHTAAHNAVLPIVQEFERSQARAQIIDTTWMQLK